MLLFECLLRLDEFKLQRLFICWHWKGDTFTYLTRNRRGTVLKVEHKKVKMLQNAGKHNEQSWSKTKSKIESSFYDISCFCTSLLRPLHCMSSCANLLMLYKWHVGNLMMLDLFASASEYSMIIEEELIVSITYINFEMQRVDRTRHSIVPGEPNAIVFHSRYYIISR